MSSSSVKRLKHAMQKYPELLESFTPLIKKPIKPSSEGISKYRHPRYPRYRKLSRGLQRLLIFKALTCPICSRIFQVPVTLECGDTFCKRCVDENVFNCPKCGKLTLTKSSSCNVLLQKIVHQLVDQKHFLLSKYSHQYCNNSVGLPGFDKSLRISMKRKYPIGFRVNNQLTGVSNECDILNEGPKLLHSSDLDCILCSRCLYKPVTTICGHTFCQSCLIRVLDYGLACPLCMSTLTKRGEEAEITEVCRVLETLLQRIYPNQYAKREIANRLEILEDEKETQMSVFICTSAFPGVACPLYVSEPRYRLLTRRCLKTRRKRFAMAAADDWERFAPYGTVLEVKDAVHLHDGTFILTTVGLRRFRVLSRGEKDGYDTAKIEYINDNPIPTDQLDNLLLLHNRVYSKAFQWVCSLPVELQAEIEQSLGSMPPLEACWKSLPDGPSWAWWLMPVLPLTPTLQLGFLSTLSLEKRLRAIDKLLDRISNRMRIKDMARITATATVTVENEDISQASCRTVRTDVTGIRADI